MYKHHYYKTYKPKNADEVLGTIYFSMGCFWNYEPLFWRVKGVVFTEVGYSNCVVDDPSCSDAFRKGIKHREVVKIYYNKNVDKEELFNIFFKNHTIDLRHDFPVPDLYKSGVFVSNEKDFNFSIKMLEEEKNRRIYSGNNYPLSTVVGYIENYKVADVLHQQYKLKNP